jgi:hypothetical protein
MDRRLSGSSSPPHISALHARHLEDLASHHYFMPL